MVAAARAARAVGVCSLVSELLEAWFAIAPTWGAPTTLVRKILPVRSDSSDHAVGYGSDSDQAAATNARRGQVVRP
jgi:hypothetical protein